MSRKSLFGVSLSLNQEWPWCPNESGREVHEISATLISAGSQEAISPGADQRLYYQSPPRNSGERPEVQVYRTPHGEFRFVYADGTEFLVDRAGNQIQARWPASQTLEDTLVYLHGPILGFALRLRGVTCLHSSAVVIGEQAVAIVGSAGMGKSTTAAAFARRGYAVQTDDLLALADRGESFWVQPGLPRVLLWPESAQALFGDAAALPRIVPTWPKLFLDLNQPGYRFSGRPLPLAAVYVLGDRRAPGSEPEIEELVGTKALMQLVANTYANYLLDSSMRAQELEALGRLVSHTRVRLLRAPGSRAAIASVCEALLADFGSVWEGPPSRP